MRVRWTVVVPVKGGSTAKSRLGPAAGLATAMAADCLAAVCASAHRPVVILVCADPLTAAELGQALPQLTVLAQPADRPGLAAAVGVGLAEVATACLVLLADLPALRPTDVDAALDALDEALRDASAAHIPDADGAGTVAIAATDPIRLPVHFGPGSAAAHRSAGSRELDLDLPRLRRDVDTVTDLVAAVRLGVGARTRRRLGRVQATVLTFDRVSGAGSVVTDDGVRLPLTPEALDGSGLLHLRPGQRVSCLLVGEPTDDPPSQAASYRGLRNPRVAAVRLHGIGEPI